MRDEWLEPDVAKYECDICGCELHAGDDAYEVGGDIYCEGCYEEYEEDMRHNHQITVGEE